MEFGHLKVHYDDIENKSKSKNSSLIYFALCVDGQSLEVACFRATIPCISDNTD